MKVSAAATLGWQSRRGKVWAHQALCFNPWWFPDERFWVTSINWSLWCSHNPAIIPSLWVLALLGPIFSTNKLFAGAWAFHQHINACNECNLEAWLEIVSSCYLPDYMSYGEQSNSYFPMGLFKCHNSGAPQQLLAQQGVDTCQRTVKT